MAEQSLLVENGTSAKPPGVAVREFDNELGNPIRVRVLTLVAADKLRATRPGYFDAVRISVEGPKSQSTNTITRLEAEHLLSALTEALVLPPPPAEGCGE